MTCRTKTGRIQLYARRDEMDEAVYNAFKKYDIGDLVGWKARSSAPSGGDERAGHNITLLSKSLLPLPEKFHGLQDKELRFRQRYVDLMVNPEVRRNFEIRSQFIRYLRAFLDEPGVHGSGDPRSEHHRRRRCCPSFHYPSQHPGYRYVYADRNGAASEAA